MKLAVIVSTYNRPDTLGKVLDGLFDQTIAPDEILIADDGSDENSRQVVKGYLRRSVLPIKYIWHEDQGFRLAEIRNKAILQSVSDYLVLLDGDCIPNKYFIEDHRNLAQKGCFFQGKRVIVNKKLSPRFTRQDANSFKVLVKHLMTGNVSNGHHFFRIPFKAIYYGTNLSGIRGCNMGFFKNDLHAVNGFNQAFFGWGKEDSELVVRLYKYGLRRKEHPFRAICYHLWHEQNERNNLNENERLLVQTIQSGEYYCESGLSHQVTHQEVFLE